MIKPVIPENEKARLGELHELEILDTSKEPEFDGLTALAAQICGTPIALISLIDEGRQWIKSSVGVELLETHRDESICAHTILVKEMVEIRNLEADGRFSENPFVTAPGGVRFYAGVPLLMPSGNALGSLCVIDRVPRELSGSQRSVLQMLAVQTVALLKLKKSEVRAEKGIARFKVMVENIQGGLLLEDKSGGVLFGNTFLRDLFFKNAGDSPLESKKIEEVISHIKGLSANPAEFEEKELELVMAGKASLASEFTLQNGSVIEQDYIPISKVDGDKIGNLWFFRDVTVRKQFERVLEMQRRHLAACAKMSALGIISSGIAHEVNNPLSIILGRARQLKRLVEQPSIDIEGVVRNVSKIEATVNRITKIIDALRFFSGDESKAPSESIPVKSIIQDVKQMCSSSIKERAIEFSAVPFEGDLTVFGKQIQIGQILINLVKNASDALEEAPTPWIRLEVEATLDQVKISVIDSGPGISPEIRDHLMVPFFTTKAVGKGTGLGLSISKGMAEQMSGSLFLDESRKETCFSLVLPRHRMMPAMIPTVLIVDDEAEIRDLLRLEFKTVGWEVLEAGDGEEAIRMIGKHKVSAIVADIRMPKVDGIELLETLQNGYSKKLPLWFLSGYRDLSRDEALRRGAVDMLPKPHGLALVAQKVSEALPTLGGNAALTQDPLTKEF
jgi:signal transduction histidine kinase/CheY-like chemotaxis protein